jgi:putative nucleotidyltransferase with HDIG domain
MCPTNLEASQDNFAVLKAALANRIKSFPTLPNVVYRVLELTSDPKTTANDLMRLIRDDLSLTTTILKVANSAFYGFSRRVRSLKQAVTILGFSEIRNIILSKAVFDSFSEFQEDKEFNIKEFWEHSVLCSLAANILSKYFKQPTGESFVAGLIHDIGKFVMYRVFPEDYPKQVDSTRLLVFSDFEAERKTFGFAHDEAGMMLLERWMFPEDLVTAVGYHHRIHQLEDPPILAISVHLADLLAHLHGLSCDTREESPMSESVISKQIIDTAQSFGNALSTERLRELRRELAECRQQESEILDFFFL